MKTPIRCRINGKSREKIAFHVESQVHWRCGGSLGTPSI
ncbi:uncharacterized protein [Blastocystis hominis]|uniref:Uncharacterized protein n=1 Tax=Blastocystis hominis TaxID=12968 RepID=D8LYX9_BLAHO|nr:uncharacterized protein [Blastocystis hominis]CBK21018.2 unnamed protein product [Blastocystis hominis]|eukprot:XP_012895066.1 uncharacterized protein [Blastocystis hominis]